MADWYTLESIRVIWRDAPSNDDALQQIIDTAKAQVLEFDNGATWRRDPINVDADGNAIPFPGTYTNVPSNLLLAQRSQARNLWNASRVDPSNGSVGDDMFTIRPFPLDWTIKAMIRPKRIVGALG